MTTKNPSLGMIIRDERWTKMLGANKVLGGYTNKQFSFSCCATGRATTYVTAFLDQSLEDLAAEFMSSTLKSC
jgi:hypothetical protein